MSTTIKNILVTLLKIGVAGGLIYWMIGSGALDLKALKLMARPEFLALFVLILLFQILINTGRWQWLLSAQGVHVSFSYATIMSFVGLFFNYFMPGGVGGDVVKGYYLLRDHPHKKMAGATSILLDRILGLYMMVALALGSMIFDLKFVLSRPQLRPLLIGVFAVFSLMSFFFFISLSRRARSFVAIDKIFGGFSVGQFVLKIYESVHSYRNQLGSLLGGLGISLISQLAMVGFMVLAAQSMGYSDIPLQAFFFAVPLGMVCMSLPIAPAGIGVGQAGMLFLFNAYLGQATQVGPTALTLYQTIGFFWGLVGGLLYLRRKQTTPVEMAFDR